MFMILTRVGQISRTADELANGSQHPVSEATGLESRARTKAKMTLLQNCTSLVAIWTLIDDKDETGQQ